MRSRSSAVDSLYAVVVAAMVFLLSGVQRILAALLRWALVAGSYPSLGRDVGVDVWRVLHNPPQPVAGRSSGRRAVRASAHAPCAHTAKGAAARPRLVA